MRFMNLGQNISMLDPLGLRWDISFLVLVHSDNNEWPLFQQALEVFPILVRTPFKACLLKFLATLPQNDVFFWSALVMATVLMLIIIKSLSFSLDLFLSIEAPSSSSLSNSLLFGPNSDWFKSTIDSVGIIEGVELLPLPPKNSN